MTTTSFDTKLKNFLVKTGILGFLKETGLMNPLTTAWCLVRYPRFLRQELDLLADYYSFKRKYGFLSEGTHLCDPEKKVLVVSLTDWIAQVKMESMLAKALQLRGYTPVIVTNRSFRRALKYFQLFGYDQFYFFDELLNALPGDSIASQAQEVLNGSPTFKSLLDFQFRDVYVGRHVLSSIVRTLRHGSVEFSDPQVMELLRRWLPEAMHTVLAAELLIEKVQPQMVLFLEKGYTPYGEIFDVAVNRSLNTIQFLHSHRSDAMIFKRYTQENQHLHPFSLSDESWNWIRRMSWTAQHESELMEELRGRYEQGTWFNRKYLQVGKRIKSVAEVREQLNLDPSKKTAVIFSHVLWDATFFFGENLFDDYEQWLIETVKIACKNWAVNWVIKVHPDYVWKMKQKRDTSRPRDLTALSTEIGDLPEHIKVLEPETDISTFSLFDVMDYCITVRGTIGIEVPCFGIPVFTAGTGRYSGLGFTIDSSSREEYRDKLLHIQDFPRLSPEQSLQGKKHAYALFKLRPCVFQTFEMVQMPLHKLGHSLDYNVVIRASSFQDITKAPDLKTFAEWAVKSQQSDFLDISLEEPLLREHC